jgi:hypothetical protein
MRAVVDADRQAVDELAAQPASDAAEAKRDHLDEK